MSIFTNNSYAQSRMEYRTEKARQKKHREKNPSVLDGVIIQKKAWKRVNDAPNRPLPMREIRDTLAQKRHEAAKVALTTQMPAANNETIGQILHGFDTYKNNLKAGTYPKAKETLQSEKFYYTNELAKACREIKEILENPNESIDHKKMQLLREKLSSALTFSNIHCKDIQYPGLVEFLQCLTYQIKTQAEGMEVLETIGGHALKHWRQGDGNDERLNFAQQLADDVEEVFHHMPADHWDGPLNWFIWAIKNIAEAFLAFIDNRISGCHPFYNSYERGNVDMWMGDFIVNGKKIRTHIGGGPMNDPTLIKAQVAWERKMGIPHVIHTLEYNAKKGEIARLKEMRDLTANCPNNAVGNGPLLSLMATPYDGKIAKGQKNFANIQKVKDFHEKLQQELIDELGHKKAISTIPEDIKKYNGFALPDHLLDEQDIKDTIKASQAAFLKTLEDKDLNSYRDEKQNARLCAAMLAGFNAFLAIKVMMKLGDKLNGLPADRKEQFIHAILERECKQCADRGPLANAVIIAFTKMIESEDGKLEEQDKKQIIGLLVGRAMIAGPDRKMVKNRRGAFIDLFRIIGKNPDGFAQELKKLVNKENGEESPIKFVPSHHENP
jgi:hypothetical protein